MFAVIRDSGLLDTAYYRQTNRNLSGTEDELLEHYLDFGLLEDRRPNHYFEARWYLNKYPDVANRGMHPLIHYIHHGDSENRWPSPLFNTRWYRVTHGILRDQSALAHYLSQRREGTFSPLPEFNIAYYAKHNPEVIAARLDPFEHFIEHGFREGRNPAPDFDVNWYAGHYLSGSLAENPFHHWLAHRGQPGVYGRLTDLESTAARGANAVIEQKTRGATGGHVPVSGTAPRQPQEETSSDAAATAADIEIEGNVDVVTQFLASGWAWAPKFPDRALEVEAVLNGEVIASATADQLRSDLLDYSKGNGKYGFVITFTRPLESTTAPMFRAIGPNGPATIPNEAEVHFDPIVEDPHVERQLSSGRASAAMPEVEGAVDYLTRREAIGWAWFPSYPELTAHVEAMLGGKIIGQAIADQLRSDLAQYGKGTGLYGFEMKFDDIVPGNAAPDFRVRPTTGPSIQNEHALPPAAPSEFVKRPVGTILDLVRDHGSFTVSGPLFEELDPTILTEVSNRADQLTPMLIAFYLPQFHAIEENDEFWGRGFTEWRQLPKALPRFPGHYQPRIPRDLGFYNLENVADLGRQVAMAKAGGIHGFAYYYYWFNRKRVLERPLDVLLNSDVDMPFMLIWANENWTRTWDGSESQVLLKQDYKQDDDDALVEDLARHFLDRRYIRLKGRPLFVIYNPKNIPDTAETIARWRKRIAERIGADPLIFMAQTFGELDPHPHGLDGALEFPPHKLAAHTPGRQMPDAFSPEFTGQVIAYDNFVKVSLGYDEPEDYPLIKTALPSWDNDCRKPNRGLTLEGIAPQKYQRWLTELINRAMDAPIEGTPIVAINAWNEWAESAYLEPDVYYGSAFLNATARAYVAAVKAHASRKPGSTAQFGTRPGVSVILPNYNHAKFLPERLRSVLEQTVPPDEIIFLDDCSSDDSVAVAQEILERSPIPYTIVVNQTNSGGVFRQWLKGLSLAKYDLIWVAETDDSADSRFLSNLLPAFARDDVLVAFGRISCIDPDGAPRADLDGYFDEMENFSWTSSCVVSAFKAFSRDFAVRNVIPNASGLVFRKPTLTPAEQERLLQYRFAGDWYFYALATRGGAIAYSRRARSFFRVNPASASRSSFFTDRHMAEHMMVVRDLRAEYGISDDAVIAHSDMLAQYLSDEDPAELRKRFLAGANEVAEPVAMRICIAAHGFAVGGGEILPVDLANALKARGVHVTYLVVERPHDGGANAVRNRLRQDIPVVYLDDVWGDFHGFLKDYGIQLINSHNVSIDHRMFWCDLDQSMPYAVSLHGGFETVPEYLTDDFIAFVNRKVDKWLYLSEKNLAFLPKEFRDPEKVLHSFNAVAPYDGEWIDRDAFRDAHDISKDAFVFVLCSRAIESKGWRTAIQVVERLADRVERPVHLVLIGDGPIAPGLREQYKGSPLVTFLGLIDRPIRYFLCFDMGLFPSTFEGETFPLFLLECFQTGLPVIATDIGEMPRLMEHIEGSRPGMLVSHTSPPDVLLRSFLTNLEDMFKDETNYRLYKAAAQSTSKRYSIDQLATLYERTLRDLLPRLADAKSARHFAI
jgi:glycosyltransferase involved in cell wall biosynthesis